MRTSETTAKLSEALAKAQSVLKNPTKDAENSHYSSKYASLDAGLNIVREALSKNGIAFVQGTRFEGDLIILETRLSHLSGEWMESEYPVCRFPAKPQELGSAMSYAKRYSLFGLVGIAGEEDDDGNAANASQIPARRVPTPPKPPAPPTNALTQEGSQVTRDMMIEAIEMAKTVNELVDWATVNKAEIDRLLEADKQSVRDYYGDKLQSLKGKKEAA